jgi:phosphate transport system substrate-binding protein
MPRQRGGPAMKTNSTSNTPAVQRCTGQSVFLLLLLATFLIFGLLQPLGLAQQTLSLVGSGSSVPAPLYAQWTETYNKRSAGIQMRYLPIGTSEGIKEISHGQGDFGAGEVPLTPTQRTEGNLIELPILVIGIVPIYNLPGVSQGLRFSGELLAGIYLGDIKNWNDPQIANLNPGVALPELPIKVYNRPGGKGSNYVFSEFLSKSSPKFKTRIGTSPSPNWPVGIPAERSSDMADRVKVETGSIGYVELQYAVKGNISIGKVRNPAGNFAKASAESIMAACREVEAPVWDKFSASLSNAPGSDSFPITGFSWLYLRTTSSDPRRAGALADLLNWMYTDGQQLAAQAGYSGLPQELLAKVRAKSNSLR